MQNLDPIKLREALLILKQIRKSYSDLGEINPLEGITSSNFEQEIQQAFGGDIDKALSSWLNELDIVEDRLEDAGKSASGLYTSFRNLLTEIKENSKAENLNLKEGYKTLVQFKEIASTLRNDQMGIIDLSQRDIKSLITKQKILEANLKTTTDILKKDKERWEAEDAANGNNLNQDKIARASIIIDENEQQATSLGDLKEQLQNRLTIAISLEKKIGSLGKMLDGFKKIPVLGDMLEIDDAKDAMEVAARDGAGAFRTMITGTSTLAKGLGKTLTSSLGTFGLLAAAITVAVKSIGIIKDVMFQASEYTTTISKNLLVSSDASGALFKSLKESKSELDSIYGTTSNIIEAFNDLSQISDFISISTTEQIESQILLTKQLGQTKEEALDIQSIFINNNNTSKEGISITYEQIAAFANQNKLLIGGKTILNEIGKTSKLILLNFKGNTKELVNTVLESKKLGLNLDQVNKIADSLLNFEQSISSEIEAELLLGKEINLEKARGYALNNDMLGLTKEIAKQNITAFEFSKMNRIQQEAIASTLGMGSTELGETLYKQELISKTAGEYLDNIKERARILRVNNKEEKAQDLERHARLIEEGVLQGKNIIQAEKTVSAQEKFNQSIERVKEIFTDLIAGKTLEKLVNYLERFVSSIEKGRGPLSTLIFGPMSNSELLSEKISTKQEELKGLSKNENPEIKREIEEKIKLLKEEKRIEEIKLLEKNIGRKIPTNKQGNTLSNEQINQVFQKNITSLKKEPPTKFAKGGIITKEINNATIGEAGPEAIIPLNKKINFNFEPLLYQMSKLVTLSKEESTSTAKEFITSIRRDNNKNNLSSTSIMDKLFSEITKVNTIQNQAIQNHTISRDTSIAPSEKIRNISSRNHQIYNKEIQNNSSFKTESNINMDPLLKKIDDLISIVRAGGNVYLDGSKVGSALSLSSYRLQ